MNFALLIQTDAQRELVARLAQFERAVPVVIAEQIVTADVVSEPALYREQITQLDKARATVDALNERGLIITRYKQVAGGPQVLEAELTKAGRQAAAALSDRPLGRLTAFEAAQVLADEAVERMLTASVSEYGGDPYSDPSWSTVDDAYESGYEKGAMASLRFAREVMRRVHS